MPHRFVGVVFAFYMAAIMAFLMSFVITAMNQGITEHFVADVLNAYKVAMPVAFLCVLAVRPIVSKLVEMTVRKPDGR
nr:DUF2798 domain-containing protein [Oceanisphaera litoralis]